MSKPTYRIHGLKLRIGEPQSYLPELAARKLRLGEGWSLADFRIVRRSIDARDKTDIRFVYAADFSLDSKTNTGKGGEARLISRANSRGIKVAPISQQPYEPPRHLNPQPTIPAPHLALYPSTSTRHLDPQSSTPSKAESPLHLGHRVATLPQSKQAPRPVVVGFGPSGIFAAYILAKAGLAPIVIERGKPVDERARDATDYWRTGRLDADSNVLFGEGGAGTFSDGKLTTGIGDNRKSFVLSLLVASGADESILIDAHPHVGTDVLRKVVKSLRTEIISLGGEIRFSSRLTAICESGGAVRGIAYEHGGVSYELETDAIILATGHSARDTYEALYGQGLVFQQKPFSIGLRIEHPQELIDRAMYGADFDRLYGMSYREAGLGAAEYKLSAKCANGRGVYTFCMCPGGEIIAAASEPGCVTSNGMSNSARNSGFANSAILVDVRTDDFGSEHPLAGIEFQRRWECAAYELRGNASPIISKTSSPNDNRQYYTKDNLLLTETLHGFMGEGSLIAQSLPDFATASIRETLPIFGRRISGFDSPDSKLCGPETRSSSPVRILRGADMQSNFVGLYPCGEGAGYAGGIMSAAVDGIKAAEKFIETSSPSKKQHTFNMNSPDI